MQCVEASVNYYIFRHIYIVDSNVVLHYFTKHATSFEQKKTHKFINASTKITKRIKYKVVNLFY